METEVDEERESRDCYDYAGVGESDIPKLLDLIMSLQCRLSQPMQILINKYLADVTSASLACLLTPTMLTSDLCANVIGNAIIEPPIYISKDEWPPLEKIFDPTTCEHFLFNTNCMREDLKNIVGSQVFEKTGQPFSNFVVVKCNLPGGNPSPFYAILVNVKTKQSLEHDVRLVTECSRYCMPILRNTLHGEEMKDHHTKLKEIISGFERAAKTFGDSHALMDSLKDCMEKILNAEMSAIFLKEDKQFVSTSQNYGRPLDFKNKNQLQNLTIPLGVGLTGIVGAFGQTLITNHPENETIYCNEPVTTSHFRNALGFPFIFKGQVFGVGEVYNRNKGGFTEADKMYARIIGTVFGPLLMQGLKLKRDFDGIIRGNHLVSMLYTEKPNENEDIEAARIKEAITSCPLEQFAEYDFLPSSVPDNDSVAHIVAAFDQLGLIEKLNIHARSFTRFLIYLQNCQQDFPFRNWFHSFCSFQFLYSMAKNCSLGEYGIEDVEIAAMMLASLCNGCSYRGATHSFQDEAGAVLASVYSSPGRRQELCAIRQSLLAIGNPRYDFMCNATHEDFHQMIQLIDMMVLSIDLAYFLTNRDDFDKMFTDVDRSQEELENEGPADGKDNKSLLIKLLMICSKISDHARKWEHALEIGKRLAAEFRQSDHYPGLISYVFVLPNINYPSTRMTLQSHFVTSVCLPAFKILQRLFPETKIYVSNLEINQKKLNSLEKQMRSEENHDQYGDVESVASEEDKEE